MADQGDIFRTQRISTQDAMGEIAATHAWSQRSAQTQRPFRATHTDTKRPASVTVAITGATANAYIILNRNGVRVTSTRANGSGNAWFYDLDDSDDHLYYASEIGSAKVWSVEIENTTVTVTLLSSGGGAGGHFSFG